MKNVIVPIDQFKEAHNRIIIHEYLSDDWKSISRGILNKDKINYIIAMLESYPYMEMIHNHYGLFVSEDEDTDSIYSAHMRENYDVNIGEALINEVSWSDIEGLGYGWVAVEGTKTQIRETLLTFIKSELNKMSLRDELYYDIFTKFNNLSIIIYASKPGDYDTIINLSDKPLN